jgi:hypothetical protein
MPLLFRTAALVVAGVVLLVTAAPASAAAGTLGVSPAAQTVQDGSAFSVSITQNADVATSGVQADMTFDSDLVQVVSVERGAAYAAAGLVVGVAPQTIAQAIAEANTTGTLQNVSVFFSPGGGSVPAGTATAVTVNLEAVDGASGVSGITLSEVEMLDTGGLLVTTTVTGGEVTVGDAPSLIWGDVNCGAGVNSVDALTLLRSNAGLSYNSGPGCPAIGAQASGRIWGDANCSGTVNSIDALVTLRSNAGLPYNGEAGCPAIGEAFP